MTETNGSRPAPRPSRISLPGPDELSPAQRIVYDEVVSGPRGVVVGPLRAVIHSPELADLWQRFGAFLRYGTSIPQPLKELAIIVVARRWNSEVEWSVHARTALECGIDRDIVDAVRHGRSPVFEDPAEREVYEFARQIQVSGQVDDATYAAVKARWSEPGVVELTGLIGYYTMVAMTLNAHHVPPPDGAAPELGDDATALGFSDIPPAAPVAP